MGNYTKFRHAKYDFHELDSGTSLMAYINRQAFVLKCKKERII